MFEINYSTSPSTNYKESCTYRAKYSSWIDWLNGYEYGVAGCVQNKCGTDKYFSSPPNSVGPPR